MSQQKKRKMLRRHRVLKSANYSGSSDTSSTYTYSLTNSMGSTPLEKDVPPMLVSNVCLISYTFEQFSHFTQHLEMKVVEY